MEQQSQQDVSWWELKKRSLMVSLWAYKNRALCW